MPGRLTVFAKGAPDVLLGYCSRIAVNGAVRPMTQGDRQQILAAVERLSAEAYRTLGQAYRPLGTASLADSAGRAHQRRRSRRRHRRPKRCAGKRLDLGRHGRHHRSAAYRSARFRRRSASRRHPHRHDHRRPSAYRGTHRQRSGHHRNGPETAAAVGSRRP